MDTNNTASSIKKKRMAVIVGIDNPIRIKSREYVLRKLFEKARKNPFVEADNLDEYMLFLAKRIEEVNGEYIEDLSVDNMYKTLKRIGWLREISYSMFILITASQYAIS
jgi:hypothetical protein